MGTLTMQKGKYTSLFLLVINNPSGKNNRLPANELERVRVGLAKLKTIYNRDSISANDTMGKDEFRILDGNFSYREVTNSNTPDGYSDVTISLVKQHAFGFEVIEMPDQETSESGLKLKTKANAVSQSSHSSQASNTE
jgi:hypothetical protein